MLDQGLRVGIGTDGVASNNDLDMFQEIHLTALIAKPATNDPTAVPAKTALLMATRLGAEACHIGHLTGSLEVGKRADLIVVERNPLHNMPVFKRDINGIYSQLVYAAKSTDVRHVMCNGRWLMRDRELLTINVDEVRDQAQIIADRIDDFLKEYTTNTISKLIAIGSLQRQESFEIQLKTRFNSPEKIETLLQHPDVQIMKASHYRQYDTYFLFDDPKQGRVRYREDDYIDDKGQVSNVRMRLTYTLPTKEREFDQAILLSRSQFYCPADRPLRFYREYFMPTAEREVHKERRRWRILYKGVLFFINLDTMIKPHSDNTYLEIKSRTWSLRDAEYKASLTSEILRDVLEIDSTERVYEDYIEMGVSAV
jgi:5-methylthioadenosine/S-adenosylhomocysteine deaminase